MAAKKASNSTTIRIKIKAKRPKQHSKKKMSSLKSSKNYKKKNRGQGK